MMTFICHCLLFVEPLPYACRNTLYDEHWSSKQERGEFVMRNVQLLCVM